MTAPDQSLTERVASALWNDYADRRRLITPTASWDDLIEDWKDEERRRARIAVAACRAGEMAAVLRETVEAYGKPGGPWNVPGDPGGWLCRARALLADLDEQPKENL